MAKTHTNNNSFIFLCWLSALCHCAAISYCIYLTVRQANLSNELASIKEEITSVRESLIKSAIPAGDVQGDDDNYKKQPEQHLKGDFSRIKRQASDRAWTGTPGRAPRVNTAGRRHNDEAFGFPGRSDRSSSGRTTTTASPTGTDAPTSAGDALSDRLPGLPAPGDSSPTQEFRDVAYVRWGKHSCREGDPYYRGYAVAFAGSHPSSLHCIPYPLASQSRNNPTAAASPSAPGLNPVKFNLQGVSGTLNRNLTNKPIKCALCHARRTEVFMVIGWTNCTGSWQEAYTGHLMTSWRPDDPSSTPSDPICVDRGADSDVGLTIGSGGSSVTYVQPGNDFWLTDRIIPCAVCIKEQ